LIGTRAKIVIGVLLTLSSAAIMYFGAQRILEQQALRDEIARLGDGLYRARVASDRCQRSVESGEIQLRDFDARIAEMRSRVDSFEALDPRGVPQGDYDVYMEHFEAYNDSVATWEDRERRLRTQDASCREVIIEHNEFGDSLRTILAGLDP